MQWTTKACIQRTLERVPGGATIYCLGQRSAGGLRHYRIDGRVEQGLRLLWALTQAGHTLADRAAVEIGSGWVPVIPMLFWLYGLKSCHTYDVTALLQKALVVEAARQFVTLYEKPAARWAAGPIHLDADRLASLGALMKPRQDFLDVCAELARRTFGHIPTQVWRGSAVQHQQIQSPVWHESPRSSESHSLRICVQHALTRFALLRRRAAADDILRLCHIAYHAPVDTAATGHAAGSMALFFSNLVLQHVPRLEIRRLFQEALRLLQPEGLMLHLIDLTDQFAHADHSISPLNFLTFSEEEFAKYNTHFCYQNRLRAASYRQLIEDADFEVIHWDVDVDADLLRQLPNLHLHRDFAGLSPEELCATSLCVVARRR